MPIWETAAANAAQGIVSTGLGLVLEKHNDKRQLRQQGKLQELQMQGQKEMTDYNYNKQMQMWNETNYKAQMEQLKKAGLNPGLIYGMGGGGGQSTNVSQGNVSGGNAPVGGGEVQSMALQLGLIKAQKENIEADTQNKLADLPNKPKQGANLDASTASLLQGVNNAKAQEKLTKIQSDIAGLQLDFDSQTLEERVKTIEALMNQADATMQKMDMENEITRDTIETKKALIRQELASKVSEMWLTNAQKKNVDQNTLERVQNVKNMWDSNIREWDKMSRDNDAIKLMWEKYRDESNGIPKDLKDILDNILIIPSFKRK